MGYFSDILTDELFEATGKNLLLLDIDDTLLTAQGIKIWRKLPTDKAEVGLTPAQYAEETVTPESKQYYDYREFRDPVKVGKSITTGIPIVGNLQMMDSYIKNGWDIGILTARGMERIIFKSIKEFLKFKDGADLKKIGDKLVRGLVFAVNDDNKKYKGGTDFAKKTLVMTDLLSKYDRVWLIDDDPKNIKAINDLKEKLRNEGDKRHGKLRAIMAKKVNESMNESFADKWFKFVYASTKEDVEKRVRKLSDKDLLHLKSAKPRTEKSAQGVQMREIDREVKRRGL